MVKAPNATSAFALTERKGKQARTEHHQTDRSQCQEAVGDKVTIAHETPTIAPRARAAVPPWLDEKIAGHRLKRLLPQRSYLGLGNGTPVRGMRRSSRLHHLYGLGDIKPAPAFVSCVFWGEPAALLRSIGIGEMSGAHERHRLRHPTDVIDRESRRRRRP